MTRVLIADDHAPTRAGIRLTLDEHGFDVVADESNAAAAVAAARRERPDVCLLDVHMPGSGIEAAAAIRADLPDTHIVMLTVSRNDSDLFEALRAGAAGYLLKDLDPAQLVAELEAVLDGQAALPRNLVTRLMEEFRRRDRRGWVLLAPRSGRELTSREWEVLELMRGGSSTAEIAKQLSISATTVRRHVGAILEKLQVADRNAAVRLVDDAGDGGRRGRPAV